MKSLSNLLHLLAGIAFLAVAVYMFRNVGEKGKILWQQEPSVKTEAASPAKSASASEEPVLSPDGKVYGVLSQVSGTQKGEPTAGEGAVAGASTGTRPVVDSGNAPDASRPNHFLHRRLSVENYEVFQFEVPPHALRPQLEGKLQSAAARQDARGASVEVLLMNEEEFARFAEHRPGTATLSGHPSSQGEIHWMLDRTQSDPQKYYLVVRNSSERQRPAVVDADFTASFE